VHGGAFSFVGQGHEMKLRRDGSRAGFWWTADMRFRIARRAPRNSWVVFVCRYPQESPAVLALNGTVHETRRDALRAIAAVDALGG
jgi:hypothetical protein